MFDKNELYYENMITGEITTDTWLVDQWTEIYHVGIIFWRWSDVCECWLDHMIQEP